MLHTHSNADPNYISIGHRQLISDRDQHPVGIKGKGVLGGNMCRFISLAIHLCSILLNMAIKEWKSGLRKI